MGPQGPAFPAHTLVSVLRNLPLDSDQESQEARLPERGTKLPAAYWHPRRWDLGLSMGPGRRAGSEAGVPRLLLPGGGAVGRGVVNYRRQFPAQESSGWQGQRFPNPPAGEGR
jgi:hypothetical protein